MSKILRSYLKYARGESTISPWIVFYPCQFITAAWMKLRLGFFSRGIFSVTDPPLPVISIGNNSFGGTNKTPMVEYIVRQFAEAGIKAGVVSRGYRTKEHPPLWIGQDENSLRRDFAGDEPLMLAGRLPDTKIVVSRSRLEGVKLLASLETDVAVTDDTFQHRKMGRDVDIVLIDGTCPFGNGWVIPAGLMREPMSAFSRADIIVITKINQAGPNAERDIRAKLKPYVTPDKIFAADVALESWIERKPDGTRERRPKEFKPGGRFIALSAIGSPAGFYRSLDEMNIPVILRRTYRDHHILTQAEITELEELAKANGADGLICTEKDLVNIPAELKLHLPLYVPSIAVAIKDPDGFKKKILEKLRPSFLVTSNGHGEDAIGLVLAQKLIKRFTCAQIDAFAFVGSGRPYSMNGIRVVSPPSVMPSGGVIKYNLSDLVGDLRSGLGSSIISQREKMRSFAGKYRTPICVGDVYLMWSVLWGQGMKPLLIATAKSVHLSGHMWIEKWLLKRRSILVWTRDEETERELVEKGVPAVFYGNPIMDLLDEVQNPAFAWEGSGAKVLLLPGSRPRAYEDIKLITDTIALLAQKIECSFVIVPAPTIDMKKMADGLDGWELKEAPERLVSVNGRLKIVICREPLAAAACGAELLIGLGGTANQLCAGLGIPVVSIIERGKLRQKKLLRDAEILTSPNAHALADAAEKVLTDPELRCSMQEAGIKNLGRTGALDKVVEYCGEELGWDRRCRVYEKYRAYIQSLNTPQSVIMNKGNKAAPDAPTVNKVSKELQP